jgi:hypothetical protein
MLQRELQQLLQAKLTQMLLKAWQLVNQQLSAVPVSRCWALYVLRGSSF